MGLPLFYENQELAKVSVGVAGVAKLCIVQRRTPHPANTRGHPSRPRRAENRKKLSGHTLQSRRRGGQGHGLLRIGGYQFQSRPSKTAAPIAYGVSPLIDVWKSTQGVLFVRSAVFWYSKTKLVYGANAQGR